MNLAKHIIWIVVFLISNGVYAIKYNYPSAFSTSGGSTVCNGSFVTLTSATTYGYNCGSGGSGTNVTVTYQWYSDSDGTPGGGSAISGATNSTFNAPTSSNGTFYYYCIVSWADPDGASACTSGSLASSNSQTVIVAASPTTSNAGSDINLTCPTTSGSLNGNSPASGTGSWSVISGSISVTNSSSATSAFTGMSPGTSAVLRWTITTSCATSTDDVTITLPLCNDDPCGATTLTVNTSGTCTYSTFTNSTGTVSSGMFEPGCGSFSSTASEDVWFQLTVPASGMVNLQAIDASGGISFYPTMSLYTGTCSNLVHVGCEQTLSTATASTGNYVGAPGSTLFIRIFDYNDNTGDFQLCASTPSATYGTVYDGTNTLSCGSTLTFMDPGGTGNYNNNQAATYTICPNSAGQYVSASFSSFSLENTYDYLIVMNGSSSNSPFIGSYTGTTSPGTITSSATNGCLAFTFQSNSTNVSTGWNASISCSSTAGTNNTSTYCSNTNCNGGCGTWMCATGSYPTSNAGSAGIPEINEQVSGCWQGAGEISTKWFYFLAQSSGTIGFTFDGPNGQDYDFAVWGPTTNDLPPCPSATGLSPIRCSYSAASNPVGIGNSATDYYEDATGNGWVAPLTVNAGETYAMCLNIFQNGNPNPTISLTVTGSAMLDCNYPLPISLTDFFGVHQEEVNLLNWITASEVNNDFFSLYHSSDGLNWDKVGDLKAAGYSQDQLFYTMTDEYPYSTITYYQLKQTDFDGRFSYSDIISVKNSSNDNENWIHRLIPNPSDEHTSFVFNGKTSNSPLNLTIKGINGCVNQKEVFDFPENSFFYTFPTNLLPNGLYLCEFQHDNETFIQKLIVTHH